MHEIRSAFTILLVEDDEDHAHLIVKSLKEKAGLSNKIIHLDNGQKAINYILKKDEYKDSPDDYPGLILLDLKMPLCSGFDVLDVLKENKETKRIPIVMLTTSSTNDDVNLALSKGVNDYIVKPVHFSELREKISQLGIYWGQISDSEIGFYGSV